MRLVRPRCAARSGGDGQVGDAGGRRVRSWSAPGGGGHVGRGCRRQALLRSAMSVYELEPRRWSSVPVGNRPVQPQAPVVGRRDLHERCRTRSITRSSRRTTSPTWGVCGQRGQTVAAGDLRPRRGWTRWAGWGACRDGRGGVRSCHIAAASCERAEFCVQTNTTRSAASSAGSRDQQVERRPVEPDVGAATVTLRPGRARPGRRPRAPLGDGRPDWRAGRARGQLARRRVTRDQSVDDREPRSRRVRHECGLVAPRSVAQ